MSSSLAIGDFSRATHLSVKTLRHYHRLGLLVPAEVDPDSSYRRYSTEQIPTAQVIRRFRDVDMPLEQIGAVLDAPDVDARNALIADHLARLEEGLAQTQEAVASLRGLLQGPPPALPIEHRSEPALLTAAISETVSLEDLGPWFQGAIGELSATLAAQGVTTTGPPGAVVANDFFATERGAVTVFVPSAESGAPRRPGGGVHAARGRAGDHCARRLPRRHRSLLRRAGDVRVGPRPRRGRPHPGALSGRAGSTRPTRAHGGPRSHGPSSGPGRWPEPAEPAWTQERPGPFTHSATMSATSASLLRSEWSPSTKWSVTGPGMAAVSRSSSSGVAKASRRPETNRQGDRSCAEVLGAEALGAARRVQRIADEDQCGHAEALGRGQGAHAAAEGAATDGDPPGRDGEPLRQCGGGGANRLDADGGRVGAALPGGLPGELDALDGHAGACDRLVNGDEP